MHSTKCCQHLASFLALVLICSSCARTPAPEPAHPGPGSFRLSSTDHVVVSAGGSSRPSTIYSSGEKKPESLKRGISLRAFNGETEFVLANLDPCSGSIGTGMNIYSFQQDIERYRNHFGTFVITVSDSAVCGRTDLSSLFSGTGLQHWQSIAFRTPYIAVLSGDTWAEYHDGRERSVTALVSSPQASKTMIQRSSESLPVVAHAGGGFESKSYTNSIDALEFNRDKYELFEIDFSWTSDDKLVCIHDWEHSYKRSFGLEPEGAKTLAEFTHLVETRSPVRKCTLDSLVSWLRANPHKRIITDIKERNLQALVELKRLYPQMLDRFIPQVYLPQEYYVARELGYEDVIWTLYIYPGDTPNVLTHLQYMDLFGLTISRTRARSGLAKQAFEKTGVRSWTHTVNTAEEAKEMEGHGVSSIYTDFLQPPGKSAVPDVAISN